MAAVFSLLSIFSAKKTIRI